jgi:hypothetical protein
MALIGIKYAIIKEGGVKMTALTNKEIFQELKTIGVNTRFDLMLYLIQYKLYFALQCANTKKQKSKFKVAIHYFFRKFIRVNDRKAYIAS